jgi:ABC-type amino acid transport system permease subunit
MIIKETSLAYSINNAIGELMCAKVSITSKTGDALSPYLIIAVIYFIVTFSLSQGVKYLEKRLA